MKKTLKLLLTVLFFLLASCSENNRFDRIPDDGAAPGSPKIALESQEADSSDLSSARAHSLRRQSVKMEPSGQNGATPLTEAAREVSVQNVAAPPARSLHPGPIHGERTTPTPVGRWNRESYNALRENGFINCLNDSLSTFSIDVDTASYANIRRFVTGGSLPPKGAVRAEELINYFTYDYPEPQQQPFSLTAEAGPSPFHPDYRLVRIGLQARELSGAELPPANLVFLVDVSGSMNEPEKLPLLKQSLRLLSEKLTARDRVAIVVYAGSDRVVLPPTSGADKAAIRAALEHLQAGGSTHASQGIVTAYELARRTYMPSGTNRVILVSDGDFNVGITSRSELQSLIERQRQDGVYLTVLGFGGGNYHDDTMELLADTGNGNYAYIDSLLEAKKVLIKEMGGTLFTLAEDVKIQVEFNPARVGAYRLIGYENRALADEDFRDDSTDAGEIGAGHRVTALYEIIPAGHPSIPAVDSLKYRFAAATKTGEGELLTVKLRYKPKGSQASRLIDTVLRGTSVDFERMSDDFRFAAAVAGYAMLLRNSEHLGTFGWDECLAIARGAKGADPEGYRAEFTRLVEMSQLLSSGG